MELKSISLSFEADENTIANIHDMPCAITTPLGVIITSLVRFEHNIVDHTAGEDPEIGDSLIVIEFERFPKMGVYVSRPILRPFIPSLRVWPRGIDSHNTPMVARKVACVEPEPCYGEAGVIYHVPEGTAPLAVAGWGVADGADLVWSDVAIISKAEGVSGDVVAVRLGVVMFEHGLWLGRA